MRSMSFVMMAAVLFVACADATEPDDFRIVEAEIQFTGDLATVLSSVTIVLWNADDGGILDGTELGTETATVTGGELSVFRFFIGSDIASVDAECTGFDSNGVAVAHGTRENANPNSRVVCQLIALEDPGVAASVLVTTDEMLQIDSIAVSPEPIDCRATDVTVNMTMDVTHPSGNAGYQYLLYILGVGDYVTINSGTRDPFTDGYYQGGIMTPGTLSVDVEYASFPTANVNTFLYLIQPGYFGVAVKRQTLCEASVGDHSLAMNPVAFFQADTTNGVALSVEYLIGDPTMLWWSCRNLSTFAITDGGSVAGGDLIGAEDLGSGQYDLFIYDPDTDSYPIETVAGMTNRIVSFSCP